MVAPVQFTVDSPNIIRASAAGNAHVSVDVMSSDGSLSDNDEMVIQGVRYVSLQAVRRCWDSVNTHRHVRRVSTMPRGWPSFPGIPFAMIS